MPVTTYADDMAQVRRHMSRDVLTVAPELTLEQAATAMSDAKVGSALVIDDARVVGILTERDIMRSVASGMDPRQTLALECMTVHPVSVEPSTGTSAAIGIMFRGGFRHLPVLENGEVVGIVSSRDLLRALEQEAARQSEIAVRDAERRRMERDIHDGAQQQMVAIIMKLRAAATMIGTAPNETRRLLAEVMSNVGTALDTLTDLAQGNYTAVLDDLGLVSALEGHARRADLPIVIEAESVGRFDAEIETAVYFCCLEAMQNVAKHANASQVRIKLRTVDGELRFSVIDDGDGFEAATTQPGSGQRNLAERLEAVGGTLDIRSVPGEGTTVIGRLPLERVSETLDRL